MFGFEIFHLLLPDAVLAGAGSVHRYCPRDETIDEFLNLGDFLRAVRVDQRQAMEIAVADVSDNRSEQTHVRDIALRFFNAFSKTPSGSSKPVCFIRRRRP